MSSFKTQSMIVVAIFALYFSATESTYADMFRCQNGKAVVFSEKPCGKDAKVVNLDSQAPTAESRDAAQGRLEKDKATALAIDKEREEQQKLAAKSSKPTVTLDQLAVQCVDKYRPHLAYPKGVSIKGHNLVVDGFGHTLYVNVKTISNPNTPVNIDPITINERFVCRLDPKTSHQSIDDNYTSDYVEKHKKGYRL